MTIRLPHEMIAQGFEAYARLPKPTIETNLTESGNMSVTVSLEADKVTAFASTVAREISAQVDAAIMTELLELNGYPKNALGKAAKWDALVRCGDCKYLMRGLPYKDRFYCKSIGLFVTERDFCSWGERKNDAG